MKNKVLYSVAAFALILVIAGAVIAIDSFRDIGARVDDNGTVLAMVNDKQIFAAEIEQSYELQKEMAARNAQEIRSADISVDEKNTLSALIEEPSKDKLLQDRIEREILLLACKEYGTIATEEVDAYFQQMDAMMNMVDPDDATAIESQIGSLKAGTGMTDAAYEKKQREIVKDSISISKLKESIPVEEIQCFRETVSVEIYGEPSAN